MLPRLCRHPLCPPFTFPSSLRLPATTQQCRSISHISDPVSGPAVFLKHPQDPAANRAPVPPAESEALFTSPPSPPSPPEPALGQAGISGPPVPAPPRPPAVPPGERGALGPAYTNPPFHTHAFVRALERTFPPPTAAHLMRATRALLVDRGGRVRREGLARKDLENQQYLFRAALSELRAELTTYFRKESANVRTTIDSVRREVDLLDGRMKQSIDGLKHEIQMELDSRKTEAKADRKRQDLDAESLLNKHLISLGEARTMMEEIRWHNMRRSILALGGFVVFIVLGMELRPKPKPVPPPVREIKYPEGDVEHNWVT